jgi:hypothetical protein
LALLSIDRLLAIAAPLFYRNLNQRLYLSAHMLVILGFNVFFFVTLIRAYQLYPNWQLTGYVGELLTSVPGVGQTLMYISFGVFSTTILVYLLVGILVKVKTGKRKELVSVNINLHKLISPIRSDHGAAEENIPFPVSDCVC